ncbi:MAG: exo-alpha-sialidase [Actinobacteria bacterium]|nr:exo-alpha-sialidase [Actinomycetota bacterium]
MSRSVTLTLSLGLLLTFAPTGSTHAQEGCGGPPTMPPLTFEEPQIIDEVRAGGEPSVEGLPDGTLAYAAHASTTLFNRDNMPDPDFVTPYTGATYLWRSIDGGDTWRYVGLLGTEVGPHATVSGFSDPDFAVDAAGNVYTSGINLANVYVAKSEDSGATWTGHPFATVMTDREWLAADEEDVVYLNGNQIPGGRRMWKSTDGGLTFDLVNFVQLPGSGPPSKIEVDKSDGRLFFPAANGTVAVYPNAREGDFTRIDGVIPGGTPHAHGFLTNLTIDRAGNVFLVTNTRNQIRVSHSTDRGVTWQTTVIHDTTADDTPEIAEDVLWPWISAGDDGRVGVSWFQADRPVPVTDDTVASYRVYAAQTVTGHGWVDGCGEERPPVYEVTVATPEPFHTGTICSEGTTCQAELPEAVDRRLGDYHTNSISADGRFLIAYSDTSFKPDGAVSHPGFLRMATGVDFVDGEEPLITEVDDADPAIEYRRGWHRRTDPAASNGGYHRRMGSAGGGQPPTARLVFEGNEIRYFYAVSEQGGSADVFLDGELAATIDYSGPAPGDSPGFGHSISFDDLGEGSHELLIAHRSGAVYVDGFEVVSGEDGGPDPAAAETRSVTTTSTGELSGLGTTVLVETVEVGPDDEWLSVVVEGAEGPVTVKLLDPTLGVVAQASQLLAGGSSVGIDLEPVLSGRYTVQVLDTQGSPATVEISIARTIALR